MAAFPHEGGHQVLRSASLMEISPRAGPVGQPSLGFSPQSSLPRALPLAVVAVSGEKEATDRHTEVRTS